jgi:hypothetical protein
MYACMAYILNVCSAVCVTVYCVTAKNVSVLPPALPLLPPHCRAAFAKQFFADLERKLIVQAAKKEFEHKPVLVDKSCLLEKCYLALKGVCDAGACKVSNRCISNCHLCNCPFCTAEM